MQSGMRLECTAEGRKDSTKTSTETIRRLTRETIKTNDTGKQTCGDETLDATEPLQRYRAEKESRRREGRRLREKREEGFSYGVLEEPRQQP